MRITVLTVCLIASAGFAGAATPKESPSSKAASPKAASSKAASPKAASFKPAPSPKAAASKATARKGPRPPAMERLTCRTGPNDEQARLIAQVVKGRPMEFAYYSRLGTGVCSIHARRGDAYTKWKDDDEGKFTVKLLHGTAALEYRPGYLKIAFDDVDRMTFCGMHGEINASIEVTKNKAECVMSGVFDLGSAAHMEEPPKTGSRQDEPKKEGPGKDDLGQAGSKPGELRREEPVK